MLIQAYLGENVTATTFTVGAAEVEESRRSDFSEFLSIVKGRSIVSAADWGGDRFELGLSGGAMIRLLRTDEATHINVMSTANPDEVPSVVLSLGDMSQQVPISIIEKKLKGLRTLYAIYYLAEAGRLDEIVSFVKRHPYGDVESALLTPNEALRIESISYGSWIVALWANTKQAYKALSSVAGLVFERGREAYLSKLDAEARLAHARARREEIAAARDEFDLRRSQLDYFLKVTSKVGIPEVKENVERLMLAAVKDVASGDSSDGDSYKTLTNATKLNLSRTRRAGGPRRKPKGS